MPSDDTRIFEFNRYQKYNKAPFIIFECIIEKIDGCKDNPENLSTAKVREHTASGFSMSTISSFRSIENKHGIYRSKDYMKQIMNS